MLYDYLQEFETVVREGSLSAAAKALAVSQSSLSRHIKALEVALGTQLLARSSNGICLTADGCIALNAALDVSSLEETAVLHFSPQNRAAHERLVYVVCAVGSRLVKQALVRGCSLLNEGPRRVALRFVPPEALPSVSSSLDTCEIDLFVSLSADVGRERHEGYTTADLGTVPCAAVFERGCAPQGADHLDAGDLDGVCFSRETVPGRGPSALWREFGDACERAGCAPMFRSYRAEACGLRPHRPDEASLCLCDGDDADELARAGCAVVPVRGLGLGVSATMRVDDAVAAALVARAREVWSAQDAQ